MKIRARRWITRLLWWLGHERDRYMSHRWQAKHR